MLNEKATNNRLAWSDGLRRWTEENRRDWLEEKVAEEWMAELKSPNSKKKARSVFRLWMGFVKMGPTEMYERRVSDLMSTDPKTRTFFEQRVKEFARELAAHHYDPSSIRSAYIAQVQSFFAHNYVPLSFAKGDLDVRASEEVKRTKSPKTVPKNEAIRRMYRIADPEDRLLIHFLYQMGMAPIDASNVRIEKIPMGRETEPDFIYWEYTRQKTDITALTALNPELLFTYKTVMLRRGWPEEGWVFESSGENRLQQRYIRQRLGVIAEKAGVEDFDPKDLRDAFNEALLDVEGMKQEIKDMLFGHKRGGARGHYSVSEDTIVKNYKMVFDKVKLDGGMRAGVKNLEKILSAITHAMLSLNPTPEFISIIEEAYGFEKGTLERMMKDRETAGDVIRRLRERLEEISAESE